MSQNTKKTQGGTADVQDYDLENQSGANFRTELNNIIYDASSNYSGDTEPKGPHVAIGMLWMDTSVSPDVLKVCTSTSGSGNTMTGGFVAVSTDTTANQTITLSGAASGSGTTAITVTVANDSHTHGASNITTGQINASFLSSDTPVSGEVLTATSGTAASWQAAAGGGNGGLLNGAGTIEAKGNRMIVTGSGGGGGGAFSNGIQGGTGGMGYNTSFGIFSVAKGQDVTVVVGPGGAARASGGSGSGTAGTDTTLTWTGGSITLGHGGPAHNNTNDRGAAGVLTLSGSTMISSFSSGASAGGGHTQTTRNTFTSGAWNNPGGSSGTSGPSGGGGVLGGTAGRCTIIGFFDA